MRCVHRRDAPPWRPSEVLTDNGKQFTGRFTRPRPAEVLFERVCRENGITARLTKPRTPTTTGKIERFHQTLRRELLDHCGPFADLAAAQAAVDAWAQAYNEVRPHQAIGMATPASLFRPTTRQTDAEPTGVAVALKGCARASNRRSEWIRDRRGHRHCYAGAEPRRCHRYRLQGGHIRLPHPTQ